MNWPSKHLDVRSLALKVVLGTLIFLVAISFSHISDAQTFRVRAKPSPFGGVSNQTTFFTNGLSVFKQPDTLPRKYAVFMLNEYPWQITNSGLIFGNGFDREGQEYRFRTPQYGLATQGRQVIYHAGLYEMNAYGDACGTGGFGSGGSSSGYGERYGGLYPLSWTQQGILSSLPVPPHISETWKFVEIDEVNSDPNDPQSSIILEHKFNDSYPRENPGGAVGLHIDDDGTIYGAAAHGYATVRYEKLGDHGGKHIYNRNDPWMFQTNGYSWSGNASTLLGTDVSLGDATTDVLLTFDNYPFFKKLDFFDPTNTPAGGTSITIQLQDHNYSNEDGSEQRTVRDMPYEDGARQYGLMKGHGIWNTEFTTVDKVKNGHKLITTEVYQDGYKYLQRFQMLDGHSINQTVNAINSEGWALLADSQSSGDGGIIYAGKLRSAVGAMIDTGPAYLTGMNARHVVTTTLEGDVIDRSSPQLIGSFSYPLPRQYGDDYRATTTFGVLAEENLETGIYETYDLNQMAGVPSGWSIDKPTDINDQGAITALMVNTSSGESKGAILLPFELLTKNPDSEKVESSDGVIAPSDPRPEVEMKLIDATINAQGSLVVRVEGTVKDRISEVLDDSSQRVHTLNFTVNGNSLDTFTLQYGQGEEPFTKANSENDFQKTFTIPSPKPGSYLFKAETDPNVAGNTGWDKVAVGLDLEIKSSSVAADPNQLTIYLPQGISNSVADTATVYFGNRAPAAGDGTVLESGAATYLFSGTVKVSGQNAPCTISMHGPLALSTASKEAIFAEVHYTPPGSSEQIITGSWVETANDSRQFYPDGFHISSEEIVIDSTQELAGSQKDSFEPLMMKIGIPQEWVDSSGFKFKVNEVEHHLKKFTYNGREETYVVENDNDTRPKIFIPSAKTLPSEHQVANATQDGDTIEWMMELGGTEFPIASTLVVGGTELTSPSLAGASAMFLSAAPNSTAPGWHQPGDTITETDLYTAYKFIYPDDFSQKLLETYLAQGNLVSLGDVLGDYSFDYLLRTDGKINIKIENDDSDIHPGIAAQYLYRGLNEALTAYSFRKAMMDATDQTEDGLTTTLETWRAQVGPAAAATGVAAAELYLSGISIVSEPVDWILAINDLSEGHYSALAAALPFISDGMISGGRRLLIKNTAGTVLEEINDVSKLQAIRQVSFNGGDIRTMGVTMEENEFKACLRQVMSSNGGPIPIPRDREGLKKAMLRSGPKPAYNAKAHHDFPWALPKRTWFAQHGIDVNNPAFGRWVDEADHKLWHERATPKFNDYWDDYINAEDAANPYTIDEILNKLSECRSQYPVTQGN